MYTHAALTHSATLGEVHFLLWHSAGSAAALLRASTQQRGSAACKRFLGHCCSFLGGPAPFLGPKFGQLAAKSAAGAPKPTHTAVTLLQQPRECCWNPKTREKRDFSAIFGHFWPFSVIFGQIAAVPAFAKAFWPARHRLGLTRNFFFRTLGHSAHHFDQFGPF